MLHIANHQRGLTYRPLQKVTITGATTGVIAVRDGEGREYVRTRARDPFVLEVGGSLGNHLVMLENASGKVLQTVVVPVNCATEIRDQGGLYSRLLGALRWTMVGWHGEAGTVRIGGKFYNYFVGWLRDHVHTMKGMKYFYPELKSGIDLYADHQRRDGMIWDNIGRRNKRPNDWDMRFSYGGFVGAVEDSTLEFKRIPVENDVEYLFLEGLYYTWKATGDTAWMAGHLDKALKALHYSTTSPYRWSTKYRLLKRGHTIDTWDFQAEEDTKRSGDTMVVKLGKTRFGVMFGDNTGMAVGCSYLAEMLEAVGRRDEAVRVRTVGEGIKARLDKLSWTGTHYQHHVPEDRSVRRDLGVDPKAQVSLSNAYSLNRGLTHKQCVAIIKTYQRIRREMPKGSPAEWFTIYPPFQRGYGGHNGMWEYMNAGVTPIVGGELAHGAFEHGYEQYGVDILKRTLELAARYNDYVHCTYRGNMPQAPKRRFTTVAMRGVANVDPVGTGAPGVTGWTGEGANDMTNFPFGRREFHGIPVELIDPAKNARRALVGISTRAGYLPSVAIPVGRTAASLYVVHAVGKGTLAGTLTIRYEDGSTHSEDVGPGKIGNWWMPDINNASCKVAWWTANRKCPNVGMYVWGVNNPHAERTIAALEFQAVKTGAIWLVAGVTLCDSPVFFMPSDVSSGIPDNWGAGAVVYALVEGLAGVKDTGVAYDRVLLAPRWEAAGVAAVSATIKYEASGGYVSYAYRKSGKRLGLQFTGNAEHTDVQILLPRARTPKKLVLDGKETAFAVRRIETSAYACVGVSGVGVHNVSVVLR